MSNITRTNFDSVVSTLVDSLSMPHVRTYDFQNYFTKANKCQIESFLYVVATKIDPQPALQTLNTTNLANQQTILPLNLSTRIRAGAVTTLTCHCCNGASRLAKTYRRLPLRSAWLGVLMPRRRAR